MNQVTETIADIVLHFPLLLISLDIKERQDLLEIFHNGRIRKTNNLKHDTAKTKRRFYALKQ